VLVGRPSGRLNTTQSAIAAIAPTPIAKIVLASVVGA
jgi:hypothetical protein